VMEPLTCEYVVQLSTPLVCHPDSMLVFPAMSNELQDAWDDLEGLRAQNIVTEQVLVTSFYIFLLTISVLFLSDLTNHTFSALMLSVG